MICNKLHRKQNIKQHKPHLKPGVGGLISRFEYIQIKQLMGKECASI